MTRKHSFPAALALVRNRLGSRLLQPLIADEAANQMAAFVRPEDVRRCREELHAMQLGVKVDVRAGEPSRSGT